MKKSTSDKEIGLIKTQVLKPMMIKTVQIAPTDYHYPNPINIAKIR